jgi:hypothetical protein
LHIEKQMEKPDPPLALRSCLALIPQLSDASGGWSPFRYPESPVCGYPQCSTGCLGGGVKMAFTSHLLPRNLQHWDFKAGQPTCELTDPPENGSVSEYSLVFVRCLDIYGNLLAGSADPVVELRW